MTHAVSQQTKARAAELKRVETTKDDYGFCLLSDYGFAAGLRKLYCTVSCGGLWVWWQRTSQSPAYSFSLTFICLHST